MELAPGFPHNFRYGVFVSRWLRFFAKIQVGKLLVNGCVSVGLVVVSYTRGQWFESSHRRICITVNCIEKTKIKKKRPGTAHFLTYRL